ncbi:unnamed protein product [Effrenium voratum]|uniref:Lipoprotein n=1 Tax=Effrenium voratum TaxID=2562239 RepID=A0AA36NKW4_9DINO|nr:unnamed protein product [Effrenium voratum]CAJ1406373.1 unnamed protein product [Effrenium voratum]CAJ1421643.1 unnamed protein product [Effrenium voratum]
MACRSLLVFASLLVSACAGGSTEASELKGLRAELAQAEAEAKEARAEAHQAEDERDAALSDEQLQEVFGTFFGLLLLFALALAALWLRNSYRAENARLMNTVVQMNEERAKMVQKFRQSDLATPLVR